MRVVVRVYTRVTTLVPRGGFSSDSPRCRKRVRGGTFVDSASATGTAAVFSVAVCFRRASPFLTGRTTRFFPKTSTVNTIAGQGHHARKDDGRHDRVPKVRSDRRLVRRGEAVMQFEDPVLIWDAGEHRDTGQGLRT